jgi:hypothetical protein
MWHGGALLATPLQNKRTSAGEALPCSSERNTKPFLEDAQEAARSAMKENMENPGIFGCNGSFDYFPR